MKFFNIIALFVVLAGFGHTAFAQSYYGKAQPRQLSDETPAPSQYASIGTPPVPQDLVTIPNPVITFITNVSPENRSFNKSDLDLLNRRITAGLDNSFEIGSGITVSSSNYVSQNAALLDRIRNSGLYRVDSNTPVAGDFTAPNVVVYLEVAPSFSYEAVSEAEHNALGALMDIFWPDKGRTRSNTEKVSKVEICRTTVVATIFDLQHQVTIQLQLSGRELSGTSLDQLYKRKELEVGKGFYSLGLAYTRQRSATPIDRLGASLVNPLTNLVNRIKACQAQGGLVMPAAPKAQYAPGEFSLQDAELVDDSQTLIVAGISSDLLSEGCRARFPLVDDKGKPLPEGVTGVFQSGGKFGSATFKLSRKLRRDERIGLRGRML